ncbi:transposase, partial [Pilimelia columellifera]|uniref:transposase n=1 Tax=Pilimelia columellifera TaxID=706574 RepID=UPI003CD0B987
VRSPPPPSCSYTWKPTAPRNARSPNHCPERLTAALVDSQSLRGAETVARSSRGYDAKKNINGRKRHIAVDTCGLLLAVLITGAGDPGLWVFKVQVCRGGRPAAVDDVKA